MRKIIVVIIILLALALAYFFTTGRDSSVKESGVPMAQVESDFRPDASNATFNIDDEPVTLSAGRSVEAVAPGSAVTEETILLDKFAYGDLNADGKEDTALLLARYGGGSGTFIYAAAVVSNLVTYRGTDAVFIGDRIAPQSISINNGIVTVKYLDRGPNEAFATEPTIATSKQFIYSNGKFEEK